MFLFEIISCQGIIIILKPWMLNEWIENQHFVEILWHLDHHKTYSSTSLITVMLFDRNVILLKHNKNNYQMLTSW